MKITISMLIGYLIGCFNPAAMIAKRKHIDLKQEGTGNLGATNAAYVLGRTAGITVLLMDILKSILSAKLVKLIFPQIVYIGMISCIGCILGHCFPIFMGFQGGKGLAAFAGMVLEYNFFFTFPIVIPGSLLVFLLNSGVAAPVWGCLMFPILAACNHGSTAEIILAVIASCVILWTHRDNLKKAYYKNDVISVRDYFKRFLSE